MKWFVYVALGWGLMLTGCTPPADRGDHLLLVAPTWAPSQVRLTCPTGDCPAGVGLFVLKKTTKKFGVVIERCTATLIGADQIMTNAHCELPGAEAAYFFVNDGQGRTLIRNVMERTYADQRVSSKLDERDLAFWRLGQPLTDVAPRTIARKIPTQMDRLLLFGVDEDQAPDAPFQTQFVLNRHECQLKPQVALLDAGVLEQTSRLALFGCTMQLGNSGAPLFTAGDLSAVQAVFNSIANFSAQNVRYTDYFASRFVGAPPAYLDEFFGMAERIHCLDIPGWPSPEARCGEVRNFRGQIAPVVEPLLKLKYTTPDASGGILWGYRAMNLLVGKDGRQGVSFIPHAICYLGSVTGVGAQSRPLENYAVGLDAENQPHAARVEDGLFEYSTVIVGGLVRFDSHTDFRALPYLDQGAPELRASSVTLDSCAPGALDADYKTALESFRQARFPGSGSAQVDEN